MLSVLAGSAATDAAVCYIVLTIYEGRRSNAMQAAEPADHADNALPSAAK